MKRGIVVTTSKYTYRFLVDCMTSLRGCKYPILLVHNNENLINNETTNYSNFTSVSNNWNGFELGGILRGAEFFDEFIHLMDTCVVDDMSMFDKMFAEKGSVYLCNRFFSYLGKYKSSIVNKIGVPKINTKEEAIRMEVEWNQRYLREDPEAVQFNPPLPIITEMFDEKHGRLNMILSNGYITKFKARWK